MSFAFESVCDGLEIKTIETTKDSIRQPLLASSDNMLIPPIGSSVVICGKSGSGKSRLLANLMKDGRFYGKSNKAPNGWFDRVFLFSPTANGDDIQKSLGIPKRHVFTDLDDAPELLDTIIASQQKKLDSSDGADKVPQYCIIFDDVIGDVPFMNSKAFTQCFYQVRHVNCTTFICTQHFKRVPRICRLQANFIFFFQGSQSEVETIVEDFAPPRYSKNEFREIVHQSTNDRFSFLTINMKVGVEKRFRKNLNQVIRLSRFSEAKSNKQQTNRSNTFCGDKNKPSDISLKITSASERIRNQNASDEQENGDSNQ